MSSIDSLRQSPSEVNLDTIDADRLAHGITEWLLSTPCCQVIDRICEAVASFFRSLFYAQSNEGSASELVQPSMIAAVPLSGERVDQSAQTVIEQIANSHAKYLPYPVEPAMKEFGCVRRGGETPLMGLVRAYASMGSGPFNAEMRYGDQKMSTLMPNGGSIWQAGNLSRKVCIAHLQDGIESSLDRITANEDAKETSTVYRNSLFSRQFIEKYFKSETIKSGILLVNKSFLSTSSRKIDFDAEKTLLNQSQLETCLKIHMRIRLKPETPIFDFLKQFPKILSRKEYEILLPAGRALKVAAYDHSNCCLDLEEVSSDAPYEIFDSSVL